MPIVNLEIYTTCDDDDDAWTARNLSMQPGSLVSHSHYQAKHHTGIKVGEGSFKT